VIDVIDALLEVEADPTVEIDRSGTRPEAFRPHALYAWTELDERVIACGLQDRENFAVELVYVAENQGEEAQQQRLDAVTQELEDKRDAMIAWIRDRESTPTWDHVEATADMDFVRTFEGRAVAVRADGYRYVTT
jgi:hypothetical protein